MNNNVSNAPAISRVFIDKNGRLQKQYTPAEAFLLKIYKGFMALPLIANVMIASLMIVEVVCLVGFFKELAADDSNGLGVYIFLITFIGLILAACTGFGWFLAEQIVAKNNEVVRHRNDNFRESELATE